MPLESVFQLCQALALLGWGALAIAPVARGPCVIAARIVAALLCAAYLVQFFTITETAAGDFSTLAGVTALFSKAGNVMLGWTHYLAFDLFIGSWEIEDAAREGLPHWLMLPILVLTLMLGPMGLLAYLALRTVSRARRRQAPA